MDKIVFSCLMSLSSRLRAFALLLAGFLFFALGAQAAPAERTFFPGSLKAAHKAQKVAVSTGQKVSGDSTVHFQIALRMRDFAKLQARVARGERISEAELQKKYYPLASDYQAVTSWASAQGLTVLDNDPARLSVRVSGPVSVAERVLDTKYAQVAVNGKSYLAAQSVPSLPGHVAKSVLAINGLQPYQRLLPHSPTQKGIAPYAVSDILTVYQAQNIPNPSPFSGGQYLTGSGQIIAIITNTFPLDADLTKFWGDNKVQRGGRIENIPVDVAEADLPKPSGEETLDVSWASSIAPDANLRVYAVGGDTTDGSMNFDNVTKGLQRILNDVRSGIPVAELSISAGVPEYLISQDQVNTQSQYYAALAASGVSVFVSSGDFTQTVEYPATDPSVTSVGGTSLLINVNTGTPASETAYIEGGGGQSSLFSLPAYQDIVNQQFNDSGAGTSISSRAVPDVALAADPARGAYLVLNGTAVSGGSGGTSWSAATWAGFGALINQSRAAYGLPTVGLLNPSIYPLLLTSNFRDIIQDPDGSFSYQYARVGYDTFTGIGVPVLSTLVTTLSNPDTFSVASFTPDSGVPGTQVTISGTQLDLTSSVSFGGTTAAAFQAASPTQLVAIVPSGASTGPITLVSRTGEAATTATSFTVLPDGAGQNDLFANAQNVGPAQSTLTGSNVGATKESGEPDHAGNPGGASVWYRWTPPSDGTYTFNTFGSSFDTLLAVYTGGSVDSLVEVASNDDTANNVTSSVVFDATFGTVYYIAVDGVSQDGGPAAQGTVKLNVAVANDAPSIDNFTPQSGSVGQTVRLFGANFLTVEIVAFNGTQTTFTIDSASQITAVVPQGATTGPISVQDGQGNFSEIYEFTVVPVPGNDLFANATAITGESATRTGTNAGAFKEEGEPNHAGNPGGSSVWFVWTAPRSGVFTFNTFNSDFDTLLAVYTGDNVAALTEVVSNDDAGPLGTSAVTFNAVNGTTYHIAVDGYNGATGNYTLNLRASTARPVITNLSPTTGGAGVGVVITGSGFLTASSVRFNGTVAPGFQVISDTQIVVTVPNGATTGPVSVTGPNGTGVSSVVFTVTAKPSNDNFGDAQILTGGVPIQVTGSNAGATKQTGEPNIVADDAGGRSIWYSWTPPISGDYVVSTQGSDFDTLLGVFSGTVLSDLQSVGSNDDDENGGVTSSVQFTATRGVTYRIAVDGAAGEAGFVALSINAAGLTTNLYTTNFETAEGFSSKLPLAGQQGWTSLNGVSGGNGVAVNAIPNLGQQGLVGQTPLANGVDSKRVYHPFFYSLNSSFPIVSFSTVLKITGSTNGQNDRFGFTAGSDLFGQQDYFSLVFDTATSQVYYTLAGDTTLFPTGVSFSKDTVYTLQVSMNFQQGTSTAVLNGTALFRDLSSLGGTSLTYITADWTVANPAAPGDNYMVFDQYAVSAPSASLPTITTQPSDQTVIVGQPVTFAVQATGTPTLSYQWYFNGEILFDDQATNSTYSIANATPSNAGRYSVVVRNAYGSVQSLDAFLVVSTAQPPPRNTVTVRTQTPSVTSTSGQPGVFILERTGDLSQSLAVTFKTFSSAQSGVDYFALSGRRVFKPGKSQIKLRVVPINRDIYDGSRVKVAIKVLSSTAGGYAIGGNGKAKLFIVRE